METETVVPNRLSTARPKKKKKMPLTHARCRGGKDLNISRLVELKTRNKGTWQVHERSHDCLINGTPTTAMVLTKPNWLVNATFSTLPRPQWLALAFNTHLLIILEHLPHLPHSLVYQSLPPNQLRGRPDHPRVPAPSNVRLLALRLLLLPPPDPLHRIRFPASSPGTPCPRPQ